jgi:hypothetical protein
MKQIPNGLRNVLRQMQESSRQQPDVPLANYAERLAAHERRIHDHPCPCGSGLRYADCCIGRINQEHLELKRRRELARQGMMTCECCGREFGPNGDLTCSWCGYDNGPGELPRTETSMRQIARRRDREMRRLRRENG